MGILEKLKSAVGRNKAEMFTYECQDCGVVFESSTPSRSQFNCPQCTDNNVISTPNKTPDDPST